MGMGTVTVTVMAAEDITMSLKHMVLVVKMAAMRQESILMVKSIIKDILAAV